MSNLNHTPGPWVAKIYDSLAEAKKEGGFEWALPSSFSGKVGEVWLQTPCGGITGLPGMIEVSAANARLIAAAPEMLQALERFVNEVPSQGDLGLIEVKNQARAAIAKATGNV